MEEKGKQSKKPAFQRSEAAPARENAGLHFEAGVRGTGTDV